MRNIIIIDDHPLTISAYKSLLTQEFENNICVHTAHNGNEVIQKVSALAANQEKICLAIVDYSIPPSDDGTIKNGTDVAALIKKHFKNCMLVFLTMHNEPLLLHNLHLKFSPQGIISKNDIDADSFAGIIKSISEGKIYRSDTMIESLSIIMNKKINFDEIDSQILLLLSKKVKSKDLPKYIELSQSAIEKRKYKIKEQLLGEKGTDKELVAVAKAYNLI
ncbi:response regulator [Flavobacterium agricola]|uniref:Response regulator n=1 Tax=Flavobacterium agricola TaxID=2870839 RepID=A0ABY6LW76_9FLAO|nr:response regulator [Flavobacterium agricola]UYW00588.1 response regulator [Flavobacterium agricola]